MVSRQEKRMKTLRWSCPWQDSSLLLGLLLWSLLPSPTASQDLPAQLHALKMAIPDSQRRIASSIRTAARMVDQNGLATAQAKLGPAVRWHGQMGMEVFIYTSTLTHATLDTLRQHRVHVLRSNAQCAIVYAAVPPDTLEPVAQLPFVHSIALPVYGKRRTGSVTSEGDAVMR